jgi:RAQPRD family integrative conjugative element protein
MRAWLPLAFAGAAVGLCLAAGPAAAQEPLPRPAATAVPAEQAARLYLSQALASLGRASQLAQQARQYGQPRGFDLDRFLAELSAVADGLQRFLAPAAPAAQPHVRIEITGEYLVDGLARAGAPGEARKGDVRQ